METYITKLLSKIAKAAKAKEVQKKTQDDVFDYLRSLTEKEKAAVRAHKTIGVSLRLMTRGI